MRDHLEFDTVPYEEEGAQTVDEDYYTRSHHEGRVMLAYLRRLFGEPPLGVRLHVATRTAHDYPYTQIVGSYDEHDDEGRNWVWNLEEEWPARWDAQARAELAKVLA